MVEVEVALVEDDLGAEKIVAMNVETEVTSLEIVVAVDAADLAAVQEAEVVM